MAYNRNRITSIYNATKSIRQGIENGWRNIDYGSAVRTGVISMVMNMVTFGATNFAMRESVGVLENIFDKTLKFLTRFINALSISPEAIIMTGMFSLPTSIGQSIIEIIINYNHNGGIIGV